MPLKTVLLRHFEVITLILSHFDLPGPGDARAPSINVNVDLVARVGGGDPHVLAGVNSANDRRDRAPGVAHCQGVSFAVSHQQPIFVGISSHSSIISHRTRYVH